MLEVILVMDCCPPVAALLAAPFRFRPVGCSAPPLRGADAALFERLRRIGALSALHRQSLLQANEAAGCGRPLSPSMSDDPASCLAACRFAFGVRMPYPDCPS
jgi:hypothetical protein